jgi:hypothetical protein
MNDLLNTGNVNDIENFDLQYGCRFSIRHLQMPVTIWSMDLPAILTIRSFCGYQGECSESVLLIIIVLSALRPPHQGQPPVLWVTTRHV